MTNEMTDAGWFESRKRVERDRQTALAAQAKPLKDLVQRALSFYEGSPDGQYDLEVVVPILREWLARASAEPGKP